MATATNNTDGTVTYSNDSTGQLTGATSTSASPAESYSYDSNGNRQTANSSTYVTGPNNEILSDGTYSYNYDAQGNCTSRTRISSSAADDYETDYAWDNRNRLTSVTFKNNSGTVTNTVTYIYDAFNHWIGETIVAGGTITQTRFVYDGNQIVMQLDKAGTGDLAATDLSHRYLWGPAVDQLLADEQLSPQTSGQGYNVSTPGTVVWPLTDNVGTVRDLAICDLTSGATSVVNHLDYSSFGQLLSQTNPTTGNTAAVDCLFGFTGRAFDTNTGLQNNGRRWYNASLGRWEKPTACHLATNRLITGSISARRIAPAAIGTPAKREWAKMRGIVTTAGGPLYFLNAYLNCRLLREKGCRLPIEWFFLGAEMTPAQIREARKIPDLRLVDLGGNCKDCAKGNGGWQSKIEAIAESRFDDVLFLDADCFPVRDPAYLFDAPLFKEHGAVLWPDVWSWSDDANPHVGEAQGRNFLNAKYGIRLPARQAESGQMLFAKQKCAKALEAVRALNRNSEETYKVVFGDKDTFLIGFLQARADFVLNPHACERFRGGLFQKDFRGAVLFAHLTDAKFQWHGRPLIADRDLPGASRCVAIIQELVDRGVFGEQARGLAMMPESQASQRRAQAVARRPPAGRRREELVRERLKVEHEAAQRQQTNRGGFRGHSRVENRVSRHHSPALETG